MAKREKSTFERLSKLNRTQRRKLQRQLFSDDPGLTIVNPRAAGIDVGNESHYVAVPPKFLESTPQAPEALCIEPETCVCAAERAGRGRPARTRGSAPLGRRRQQFLESLQLSAFVRLAGARRDPDYSNGERSEPQTQKS